MGLTTDLPIEKLWRYMRSMIFTKRPEEMSLARDVLRRYAD
tara:strand:- start:283 stop:405 length:123 start_codon:yes stop_codon:yes gene_type:complete